MTEMSPNHHYQCNLDESVPPGQTINNYNVRPSSKKHTSIRYYYNSLLCALTTLKEGALFLLNLTDIHFVNEVLVESTHSCCLAMTQFSYLIWFNFVMNLLNAHLPGSNVTTLSP